MNIFDRLLTIPFLVLLLPTMIFGIFFTHGYSGIYSKKRPMFQYFQAVTILLYIIFVLWIFSSHFTFMDGTLVATDFGDPAIFQKGYIAVLVLVVAWKTIGYAERRAWRSSPMLKRLIGEDIE